MSVVLRPFTVGRPIDGLRGAREMLSVGNGVAKGRRLLYFSGVVPVEYNAGYTLMFRHLSRIQGHLVLTITRDFEKARGLPIPHLSIRLPERSGTFLRVARKIVGSPVFWLEHEALRVRRLALAHAQVFQPTVMITLWATPYLLAAADLAEELGVPLVLICHDDFEQMLPEHPRNRSWAARRLAPIYRRASRRICASPGMAEHLARLYGSAPSEIIYPIPAEPADTRACAHLGGVGRLLQIGFFGELGGNYAPICAVIDQLQEAGAEFHFFSHSISSERDLLSQRVGVHDWGATSPRALHEFFRREIDVVLVPQGFEPQFRDLRSTCFPSKLPEACQMRLPLLIVAPAFGSAARWGREHLDPRVVVESLDKETLLNAIRLFKDESFWRDQQRCVARAAATIFQPSAIQAQFEKVLFDMPLNGIR